MDIVRGIISNLVPHCGCGLTEDHVTQRGFQCFPSSPQAVTYRAELWGTREASVEDLLQDMQQWIQDGATFNIQFQILEVDGSCDLVISSFTDPECTSTSHPTGKVAIVIGSTVGSAALLLMVVITAAVAVKALRRK